MMPLMLFSTRLPWMLWWQMRARHGNQTRPRSVTSMPCAANPAEFCARAGCSCRLRSSSRIFAAATYSARRAAWLGRKSRKRPCTGGASEKRKRLTAAWAISSLSVARTNGQLQMNNRRKVRDDHCCDAVDHSKSMAIRSWMMIPTTYKDDTPCPLKWLFLQSALYLCKVTAKVFSTCKQRQVADVQRGGAECKSHRSKEYHLESEGKVPSGECNLLTNHFSSIKRNLITTCVPCTCMLHCCTCMQHTGERVSFVF